MADKLQYYELLVEYKGTKTSGAPMAAAASGWGAANIFARSVFFPAHDCLAQSSLGSIRSLPLSLYKSNAKSSVIK
jgi:hypothetical protein